MVVTPRWSSKLLQNVFLLLPESLVRYSFTEERGVTTDRVA